MQFIAEVGASQAHNEAQSSNFGYVDSTDDLKLLLQRDVYVTFVILSLSTSRECLEITC